MNIKINIGKGDKSSKYGFFAKLIVMILAVLIADYMLPGVSVSSFWVAIITALVISLLNNFLRPILIVLTLPFTIFSMGLFLLVINALIIWITGEIISGFTIDGFGTAFWFALLITILTYLLEIPNKIRERHNKYHNNNDDFDECEDVTNQIDENKN